ncbi:MAG: iron uptake porin [Symploca sp. SIO2G7]|nr:iron uptake porin [Symploca sp. SIO2G7]
MSKLLWKSLLISPVVFGAALVSSNGEVRATESTNPKPAETLAITEVTEPQVTENQLSQSPEAPALAVEAQVTENQLSELPEALAPATELAQVTPAAPSNDTEILEQLDQYNSEGESQSQLTSITELSDVSPGDWAYDALRELVEDYKCIVGYPDRTFRGNRPTSRYEFAAGLRACLDRIQELIAAGGVVTEEDLETLRTLIQQFDAELAVLGTRVDNLDARVAFLEDHQFSTTTKLQGEVIFALTDTFPDDEETFSLQDVFGINPAVATAFLGADADGNVTIDNDTETIFGDRVRLIFNTSFTGNDSLITRLAAGNLGAFTPNSPTVGGLDANGNLVTGAAATGEATQTFNLGDTGNDVIVDWLAYYFNWEASSLYVAAFGGIHSDYVANTFNPFFEDFDGGNGALSTFASENPIYRIGGGAGGAITLGVGPLESILGPNAALTLGYLAGPDAANPTEGNGIADGEYSALGQLSFNLGDRIGIGLTYNHAYHRARSPIFDLGGGRGDGFNAGVVGSFAANQPGLLGLAVGANATPTVTNSYGGAIAIRLSENISISGFGTYTDAILIEQGEAEIWTYGAGLAFANAGKEGNVLGIFGGAQPYAGSIDVFNSTAAFRVDDIPYHIEAFYKYQVSDNISVTPGVIWLLNPNQTSPDAFIGTLRTTFTF